MTKREIKKRIYVALAATLENDVANGAEYLYLVAETEEGIPPSDERRLKECG